jgi:hypothetical protein
MIPTFVRFKILKERQIVDSWAQLANLQQNHGFPEGRLLGVRTRVWTEEEISTGSILARPAKTRAGLRAGPRRRPREVPMQAHPSPENAEAALAGRGSAETIKKNFRLDTSSAKPLLAQLDAARDRVNSRTDAMQWACDLLARFRRARELAELIGLEDWEVDDLKQEAARFCRYVRTLKMLAKLEVRQ